MAGSVLILMSDLIVSSVGEGAGLVKHNYALTFFSNRRSKYVEIIYPDMAMNDK